jgi:hypothetical protein
MDFKKNGIVVSVSDQVIEQLVLERLRDGQPPPSIVNNTLVATAGILPRIGAEVAELGGVFAGVARGVNSEPDYYLIVGPEASGTADWNTSKAWAAGITHLGFNDFELPRRKEQALLFANVPELFQKEWYWSSEQHAVVGSFAWMQNFYDGHQNDGRKDFNGRARAVRRVPIQ